MTLDSAPLYLPFEMKNIVYGKIKCHRIKILNGSTSSILRELNFYNGEIYRMTPNGENKMELYQLTIEKAAIEPLVEC